jgi:hypothetical protein
MSQQAEATVVSPVRSRIPTNYVEVVRPMMDNWARKLLDDRLAAFQERASA